MTLDIMVVVVASIVIFQFRPLTAIMIVALALLDDIPIMTIAYDNVPASASPVRWNMTRIFIFASLMGLLAMAETFGLLLVGMRWLLDSSLQAMVALDPGQIQTLMFLQLAVGGHLLLFSVRTKKTLFHPPYPSIKLFGAIAVTQIVAVLICILGFGVEAVPGAAVVGVWLYCLIWVGVIEVLKLSFWSWVKRRDDDARRVALSLAE